MQKIIEQYYGQRKDTSNIRFVTGPQLSIVFKQRLAYYAWYHGITLEGYGSKTLVQQAKLYLDYRNKVPGANVAALPGQSRHNFDIAFDVNRIDTRPDGSGLYPGTINADFLKAPAQQTLAKFGLCIPMWNGASTKEPWHIQPIETIGYPGEWYDFLTIDDLVDTPSGHRRLWYETIPGWTGGAVYMRGNDVKFVQAKLRVTVDGAYGPGTAAAVAAWRKANGLSEVGVVDDAMWTILMKPAPGIDYRALYESLKAGCDTLNKEVQVLRVEVSKLKGDLTLQGQLMQTVGDNLDRANARIAAGIAALSK